MGRRDEWKQVQDSMRAQTTTTSKVGKTVEDREKLSDNACGLCKGFKESGYEESGRGSCGILKMGSDISKVPPKVVTEGGVGFITFADTDGVNCPHFSRLEYIDKDPGEVTDPTYQRAHRQFAKK